MKKKVLTRLFRVIDQGWRAEKASLWLLPISEIRPEIMSMAKLVSSVLAN
jgi:hypothetical protein